MIRWLTSGESHGAALAGILDGVPAGVAITQDDIAAQLQRRRLGYGRGARMSFEQDAIRLVGGVRHGLTLGSPISLEVGNTEWPKWEQVMSPDPVDPEALAGLKRNEPLTRPRPGHADLAGQQKYGHTEARPILERASARETAMRTALGAVAKQFLHQTLGIQVLSHTVSLGHLMVPADAPMPTPADVPALDNDPLRCHHRATSTEFVALVDATKQDGDTLGGVVEVLAYGVPPGLGSHVQWDRKLDAALAAALMSVPAIKGVEIGDGFETAKRPGSAAHDELVPDAAGVTRLTNRAGGLEGGISNGEVLWARAAMKPISTVPRALQTIDTTTGEATRAHHQRSDVCAVPAAGVVGEAMMALVLANAVLEKFGGDHVDETARNARSYLDNLPWRPTGGAAAHPSEAS